jgi:hypothetical protein
MASGHGVGRRGLVNTFGMAQANPRGHSARIVQEGRNMSQESVGLAQMRGGPVRPVGCVRCPDNQYQRRGCVGLRTSEFWDSLRASGARVILASARSPGQRLDYR